MYYAKCPKESCPHGYVGESGRRLLEQVIKTIIVETFPTILFKHCVVAGHQFVSCDYIRIVGRNYHNNKRKCTLAKELLIKNLKSLNVQKKSVAFRLFN